jgi:single-stranded-DNA-specific exonuclease
MNVKELVPKLNKDTFVQDYCEACGVEDVDEFLEPTGKYVQQTEVYSAIERKVKWFREQVEQCDKIAILCDSDNDGLCSTTISYKMLRYLGIPQSNIQFLLHTDKGHGLTKEIMAQLDQENDIAMLLIPDAGSNDIEQIERLLDRYTIVVLDHHSVNKSNIPKLKQLQKRPNFCIVNNQLEEHTNKNLCGTGVVFKFWQALCKYDQDVNNTYANYLDIVALANIADVMDMRQLENVAINKWGLGHITNEFLVALCNKYYQGTILNRITPTNIAWDIAPKLNAVCRSDDQATKLAVLEAFCDIRTDYDNVIKAVESCYNKQRNDVKKIFDDIINNQADEQDEHKKVIVKTCGKTPYTGLIANKLMSHYNKPIILTHEYRGVCSGSARSPVPLRELVEPIEGVMYAQGHDEAFGLAFKSQKLGSICDKLEKLKLNNNPERIVATSLNPSDISTWLFGVTEQYAKCWGEGVKEPIFYISHIKIKGSDIREMGNGTTLKFTYKGIEYLKFFASKNDKETLKVGKNEALTLNLLGSLGVNRYGGKEAPQVKIEKFEVVTERWEDLW